MSFFDNREDTREADREAELALFKVPYMVARM